MTNFPHFDSDEWCHRALDLLLDRVERQAGVPMAGLPHWTSTATGDVVTTVDGDWTGGSWVGQLWLLAYRRQDRALIERIHRYQDLMKVQLARDSVFRGFGFYLAAGLGDAIFDDRRSFLLALSAASSVAGSYSDVLGLIPIGSSAEEADHTSPSDTSIDSLQAVPLLLWAAAHCPSRSAFLSIARNHARRVLDLHVRADGSVIQSTSLDARTGQVLTQFTHKGMSDTSVWSRAQAWAILYSATLAVQFPTEDYWTRNARLTLQWWLDNVPQDGIAPWDFDADIEAGAPRDTSATVIACAGALRLAYLDLKAGRNADYLPEVIKTLENVVDGYVVGYRDFAPQKTSGLLGGGCFSCRKPIRSIDDVQNADLVFGTYYLIESLMSLTSQAVREKLYSPAGSDIADKG